MEDGVLDADDSDNGELKATWENAHTLDPCLHGVECLIIYIFDFEILFLGVWLPTNRNNFLESKLNRE